MAESYSVKAVLSAKDSGFSSTLKSASGAVDSLASKVKSGFSFGILTGMGQQAFSALTNGARNLVGEINSSNKAWKTFDGNMKILGKGEGEINKVKSSLQKFAQDSIYSSSDMASTYAQLAAVGTKSADKLVTGFGGLAAAAENPTQAMKTLSQQAVQMAAKPEVAWADFKLMLEQTPAGIAAVAKEMGMSTSEMVTAVQDGEIATEDFFNAINKVGNSTSFQKLATSYKGVDEAMAGLQETLGNKLTPAFDVLSTMAIGGISGIIDKISEIDGEALADKVTAGIEKAQPYWEAFKDIAGQVGDALKVVGGFFLEHSDTIAKCLPYVIGLVAAYKGFKFVSSVVPGMVSFASSITSLATGGIKGLAAKLFGVAGGQKAAGNAASTSAKQLLAAGAAFLMIGAGVLLIAASFALLAQSAIALSNAGGLAIGVMAGMTVALVGIGIGAAVLLKTLSALGPSVLTAGGAMLMMGAAVLLVGAGFALMAQSSIALANAGGLAIGVMVGMVAVVALLAIGAAALGPALTAGAVGFIAFGAAIALVGVGALLAATSLMMISAVLPTIVTYGAQGAVAIAQLGAGMIAFAAGAALAGAAALILGAGLTVAAVGIAAVGVAIAVLGAGVVVLAAGALVAAASVALLAVVLPQVAAYGQQGATALTALGGGMLAFAGGAAVAGAACIVLGAGLVTVAAGLTLTAAGALLAAAGVTVLAAGSIMLAAGIMLCAASVTMLAGMFPAASAGAMMLVATFTALLGMSAGLGAALFLVNAPLLLIGASALVASAGIIVFGAGMVTAAAGTLAMAAALKSVKSSMKSIASSAKTAQSSLKSMQSAVKVVESGLNALGSKAKSAMNQLTSAFDQTASKAQASGQKVGQGFTMGMQSGLNQAPVVARASIATVVAAFRSGYGGAYSSGAYISKGFAAGMRSCLGEIRAAASAIVAAANAAIEAKARIASPSKVTTKLGGYYGKGYVNGILDNVKAAWKAAEKLVSIPQVAAPKLAMAYGGEMSADYDYFRSAEYVIEVPLAVDGREFARATATYTQDELDKRQTRDSRKRGKV